VRNESELHGLLKYVNFPSAGVIPHTHANLFNNKSVIMKGRSLNGNTSKSPMVLFLVSTWLRVLQMNAKGRLGVN